MLSAFDRNKLTSSGLTEAVISSRGYQTIETKSELGTYGFARSQGNVPAMLIPVYPPDGQKGLYVIRPEKPREIKGKELKYELPKDTPPRIDCPRSCLKMMGDPSIHLWITEGPIKADALVSKGFCAIALLGVNSTKSKNEMGGTVTSVDFDSIALSGRPVFIVFDSDVTTKPQVKAALDKLYEILDRRGATVRIVYLPSGPNGEKVGVDDYLLTHTADDLKALADKEPPTIEPKAPVYEILDEEPPTMTRPLMIIEGHAYAGTWATVRCTKTEDVDKNGKVIKFTSPQVSDTKQLFIVRDDGVTYGFGGDHPIESIGFKVVLREELNDGIMTAAAIKRYRANENVDVRTVFNQVVDTFDHFLDYDGSIAPQRTMCELMACFAMATYFLDAVDVAGYIYSTGEKGSGKSQNLQLTCRLAYLGQFIQAAGSFAAMRDMSDYGAFLGFDDAENVSRKDFDPDKRAILLSGSSRGSTVPLKEPGPDRAWITRYVNVFTYRGFSAIREADNVLGSRSITVPLVRTDNKAKGTASVSDDEAWPHDRKRLIADLWCIALRNLVNVRKSVSAVKAESRLIGRDLEPWIGVLTIAKFIDGDLFKRLEQLSVDYQKERSNLETSDLTPVIIRAIVRIIFPSMQEPFDLDRIKVETSREWKVATSIVTETVLQIVEAEELDFNPEYINGRRIGRALKKLRLTAKRDGKSRNWLIPISWIEKNLKSYSLTLSKSDVSDVCDIGDVNRETPKIYNNVTSLPSDVGESDVTASLESIPQNVTAVTNVTNVTVTVKGETAYGRYGYCPCGDRKTVYIGKVCPGCNAVAVEEVTV